MKYKRSTDYIWASYAIFLVSSVFIFFTLRMNYSQINSNLKAGYGFTDESVPLIAIRERLTNGQSSYSLPFSEPLLGFFWLAGESIYKYRVIGLIVLALIPFLFYVRNFSSSYIDKSILLYLAFYMLVSVFTIPSVFRFLLVTPTYQWILLVLSVLLNIILVGRQPIVKHNIVWFHAALTACLFAMILARAPSGGVGLISVLFYFVLVNSRKDRSSKIVVVSQLFLWIVVISLNLSNLRNRFLESVKTSQAFDPNGYSLFPEILDVLSGVSQMLFFLVIPFYIVKKFKVFFSKNSLELSFTKLTRLILTFVIVGIAILCIYPQEKLGTVKLNIAYLTVLIAMLGGLLLDARKYFALILISFLPYTSQFGSNTPASTNIQIIYICQSLLLINIIIIALPTLSVQSNKERSALSNRSASFCLLSITAILMSLMNYSDLVKSQIGNSYEKTLYPAADSLSRLNGLYYTSEKLERLNEFVKYSSLKRNEEVIDLSSFHPGLIYYAGGIQSERTLPDKYFIYNIKNQVKFVLESQKKKMSLAGTKILLESKLQLVSRECRSISSLFAINEISDALKIQGFDINVRPLAVYKSLPEDLTLFPNNALLVETCIN